MADWGKYLDSTSTEVPGRSESIDILRENFEGGISISGIEELGYSKNIIYKNFDSLEHAERVVFGTESNKACSNCGVVFDNRTARVSHEEQGCDRQRLYERANDLVGAYDRSSNYIVYRLEITHGCDGVEYYYVGMTTDLEKRLTTHMRVNDMSIPHQGEMQPCSNYNIISANVYSTAKNRNESLNKERECAFETAIEYETTRVLGGK